MQKSKVKGKAKRKKQAAVKTDKVPAPADTERGRENKAANLCCNVCKKEFQSRNKLFQHIKDTGHAVQLTPSTDRTDINQTRKKGKRKQ